jgi:hypothetical protein
VIAYNPAREKNGCVILLDSSFVILMALLPCLALDRGHWQLQINATSDGRVVNVWQREAANFGKSFQVNRFRFDGKRVFARPGANELRSIRF